MAFHCPECNHPSDTRHGMAMHLLNANAHPDIDSFDQAEKVAGSMEESAPSPPSVNRVSEQSPAQAAQSATDSSGGTVADNPFPKPSTGSQSKPEASTGTQQGTKGAVGQSTANETQVVCPGCGSSMTLPCSEALEEFGSQIDRESKALMQRSDYVCGGCGGVFDR